MKPPSSKIDEGRIVLWRSTCWFAKPGGDWRERLAYLLGRGVANVCEVLPITEARDATLMDGRPAALLGQDCLLIRLAQSHELHELPIQDGAEAIAFELVYSVWIRRRDPSAWNRGYVEGVPLFFDHHIAFGREPENVPLDSFFRGGSDGGYPRNWRLESYESGYVPTAKSEREYEVARSGFALAIHRVPDEQRFRAATTKARDWIAGMSDNSIILAAGLAQCPDSAVVPLLVSNRNEINDGLQRLFRVLDQ